MFEDVVFDDNSWYLILYLDVTYTRSRRVCDLPVHIEERELPDYNLRSSDVLFFLADLILLLIRIHIIIILSFPTILYDCPMCLFCSGQHIHCICCLADCIGVVAEELCNKALHQQTSMQPTTQLLHNSSATWSMLFVCSFGLRQVPDANKCQAGGG